MMPKQQISDSNSPDSTVSNRRRGENHEGSPEPGKRSRGRPAGRKKSRRQQHGSAWHWTQTDCWYYTLPGSKKRIPLFNEDGERIRGKENKEAARLAMARARLAASDASTPVVVEPPETWLVAQVCSEYLQYCERGLASGAVSRSHQQSASWFLNDFCGYCGAIAVSQLKKSHVKTWLDRHAGWKSAATHRLAIGTLLAALNYSDDNHGVGNPLKGLKRPTAAPRLASFSKADEETLLAAAEEPFGNFLFAAIHTGLRPYCELARLTAEDVEETPRGMMWRVYSSKTKKTRKIPVRPEVAELTRRLLKDSPAGSGVPVFRTTKGRTWAVQTGVTKFFRLRRKLRWDKDAVRKRFSTYTGRHTFAHRMLSGYWNGGIGCSIETLAELMGDTPKVAFDHYGKEWGQHYQDPLWAAVGVPAEPKPIPRRSPATRRNKA
jgi:integrase